MILYCYDESGVYTGPISPVLSPARPFVNGQPNYILPTRATELPPPAVAPGFIPVFDGKKWVEKVTLTPPQKSTLSERIAQAEAEVIAAAEEWVAMFEKYVDHKVPFLPHNRTMCEAVHNLRAAKEGK